MIFLLVGVMNVNAYTDDKTGFLHYYTFDTNSKDYYGRSNGTDYNVTYLAANFSNGASVNGTSSYIKYSSGFPSHDNRGLVGWFRTWLDWSWLDWLWLRAWRWLRYNWLWFRLSWEVLCLVHTFWTVRARYARWFLSRGFTSDVAKELIETLTRDLAELEDEV